MSNLSLPILLMIGATFFTAGTVKGVTGMGLPTVAMGLLSLLMSPLSAATLLIVPSFVTNVWQLLAGPRLKPTLKRFWPMMLAITLGTFLGAATLNGGANRFTANLLGVILIIYASHSLAARQIAIPSRFEPLLSPCVGVLTGVLSGATGLFVVPAVPYLQSLDLSREDLVQAFGLSFTVSTIALALALGTHGAIAADGLGISLLAVVPALAGMWLGQKLRRRISPAKFRRIFLIFLLLVGGSMLW